MRKTFSPLILAALAAAVAASPLAAAAPTARAKPAAPAKRDWTTAVVDTADGWRMGNPKAPHHLVEYLSFNCSHCASLSHALSADLMALVREGRISLEYRPKTIFAWDPSAAVLARCVPARQRFAFIHDYMENQQSVRAGVDVLRADAEKAAKVQEAVETDPAFFLTSIADAGGMIEIAARHGLPRAKAEACLKAPGAFAWTEQRTANADAAGIEGTPTLLLDGTRLDPSDYGSLRARLAR